MRSISLQILQSDIISLLIMKWQSHSLLQLGWWVELVSKRERSLSGKVMGEHCILKSTFCFRESVVCNWCPQEHALFQATLSVHCYSQEHVLFQGRWWVELVSSMAWCSFVATGWTSITGLQREIKAGTTSLCFLTSLSQRITCKSAMYIKR